jgi:hypothetical protein
MFLILSYIFQFIKLFWLHKYINNSKYRNYKIYRKRINNNLFRKCGDDKKQVSNIVIGVVDE